MMDLFPRKVYLDDIFDDFLTSKKEQMMKCDIYEKGDDYHLELDIPGFDKKDISIEVNNGYLTIKAEKNQSNEEKDKDKKYIRKERVYGKYERSFYIGDIDEEKINAEFKDGMLKITVPKKEENKSSKYIDIK